MAISNTKTSFHTNWFPQPVTISNDIQAEVSVRTFNANCAALFNKISRTCKKKLQNTRQIIVIFFTMFWYHWIFPWNKFYLLKIIPFKLFVVHFVSSRLLLTSTYPMLLFSYYYFFLFLFRVAPYFYTLSEQIFCYNNVRDFILYTKQSTVFVGRVRIENT